MKNLNKNSFLFKDISSIKGVGKTLEKYLKNKKVDKVKDLLLDLPYEVIDRSEITSLDKLEIGKITTIQVTVKKYNFPRIRNLPNKVICSDENKYSERFNDKNWDINMIPFLKNAQANIFCKVDKLTSYHTHTIVVGMVEDSTYSDSISTLTYVDGKYE